MLSIPAGIVISERLLQYSNASFDMLLSPLPIFTEERYALLWKAYCPMLITVSGITTAESELAAKALPPISVTLPRSTDKAFVYAKAHEPIYLTFSGTVYAAVLPAGYATIMLFV